MQTHTTKATKPLPKLLAVLGNPIKHSLSPTMHNYAAQKLNLDSLYTRFFLPQDISAQDLREFLLSSDIRGANITLPFKERAFFALDSIEGVANDIGAVNTIVKRGDKLMGYNTDADGFYHSIKQYTPKNVLLLGAGGSAKSLALILTRHNICVTIANRSKEKLESFSHFGETLAFSELTNHTKQYDIIINATSASVQNMLPLPQEMLTRIFEGSRLCYDLMYCDVDTPFCALARKYGVTAVDGKMMLIFQGALAFFHFHDMEFSEEKFREVAMLMAESLGVALPA